MTVNQHTDRRLDNNLSAVRTCDVLNRPYSRSPFNRIRIKIHHHKCGNRMSSPQSLSLHCNAWCSANNDGRYNQCINNKSAQNTCEMCMLRFTVVKNWKCIAFIGGERIIFMALFCIADYCIHLVSRARACVSHLRLKHESSANILRELCTCFNRSHFFLLIFISTILGNLHLGFFFFENKLSREFRAKKYRYLTIVESSTQISWV